VTHFEIPYDDGDRAKAFYRQAFGWQIVDMPEYEYTAVSTGHRGSAGRCVSVTHGRHEPR
jgi:predicted enzyme related to lactoylglutathione lyase